LTGPGASRAAGLVSPRALDCRKNK